MEDVRNWREYPIESKKDCVGFGYFLMNQNLIFIHEVDEDIEEDRWETSDGEWLTMEELYDKFWRITGTEPRDD